MFPYLNNRLNYALFRPGAKHPTDFMDNKEFTNLLFTNYGLYLDLNAAMTEAQNRAKTLIQALKKPKKNK